ncbi:hypothetical protein TNCV_2534221 [Trichonephila clavipes]|nr:hypothetical protein TNCV_2534221 [Trichonephila clavipes]
MSDYLILGTVIVLELILGEKFKFQDLNKVKLRSWQLLVLPTPYADNQGEGHCKEPLPAPGNRSNERRYKDKDLPRTEEKRSERGRERESGGEENQGCEK